VLLCVAVQFVGWSLFSVHPDSVAQQGVLCDLIQNCGPRIEDAALCCLWGVFRSRCARVRSISRIQVVAAAVGGKEEKSWQSSQCTGTPTYSTHNKMMVLVFRPCSASFGCCCAAKSLGGAFCHLLLLGEGRSRRVFGPGED
jgi:hypothetical protein